MRSKASISHRAVGKRRGRGKRREEEEEERGGGRGRERTGRYNKQKRTLMADY